jgi:hypothetical protein
MPALAVALLCSALAATGCQARSSEEVAQAAKKEDTADLMKEAAKSRYTPPRDGQLTDEQVRMYLQVKDREHQIREQASRDVEQREKQPKASDNPFDALGDVGELATADLRAAKELGQNLKEYQWVRDRIQEAQMAEVGRNLSQQVAGSRDKYIASLEEKKKGETDPARIAEIDKEIQEFRGSTETPGETPGLGSNVSSGVEQNIQLLAQYKAQLDQIQAADQKLANGSAGTKDAGKTEHDAG